MPILCLLARFLNSSSSTASTKTHQQQNSNVIHRKVDMESESKLPDGMIIVVTINNEMCCSQKETGCIWRKVATTHIYDPLYQFIDSTHHYIGRVFYP